MITALAFGGAFNPPTRAHIELANEVRKAIGVERVVFIPSKSTYIQNDQGKDFAFSDEQRYEMLNRIAEHNSWMEVSDLDLQGENQPRTYLTLCKLQKLGYQCQLLCGSDKMKELQCGWLYIDEIMREFGVVTMSRGDDQIEELIETDPYLHQYKDCIKVVKTHLDLRHVSSTKVRQLLREHASKDELCQYIPEEVYDFLQKQEVCL